MWQVPLILLALFLAAIGFTDNRTKAQLSMTGVGAADLGAAGLTWTNLQNVGNGSCGGGLSCTISGVTVTTGFNIVGPWVTLIGGAQLTAVTVCGTSMTQVVTSLGAQDFELWSGTVTGGTCNVVITNASAGISFANVFLGVLSGQISNTATSTCTFNGNSGLGTQSCSSALTVPANGIAIAAGGAFSTTNCNNMTNDVNPGNAAWCHNTTAGSLTPSISTGASGNMGIAGATWH
jgi:hypothetical protein